ncbi:MAG: NUDIX hydrolase [Ignavibacteria bacterium]|nr:NUDIX hydrolase [Ignavibacteria bacterium]MBT8382522.1 NUDIX hydrolase [Ignavibacteria bacterium]MBT8390840.1 NUDIX hydrolase [Ignavibacteria bacterium]NNJ54206.1 NUDIX hydrolase [Ignavibacteriaceae bacterium]NNL21222.1 NUDIX hydrolase [Ignavibacteriaceae bacterium]
MKKKYHFEQSGAIPFRIKNGKKEILLVTSIRKKRWIIPKGFIEYHLTPFQSAKKEAFEEAGVRGSNSTRALGYYKIKKYGGDIRIKIYSLKVSRVYKEYPEKNLRKRKWYSIENAVKKVDIPQVAKIIKKMGKNSSSK